MHLPSGPCKYQTSLAALTALAALAALPTGCQSEVVVGGFSSGIRMTTMSPWSEVWDSQPSPSPACSTTAAVRLRPPHAWTPKCQDARMPGCQDVSPTLPFPTPTRLGIGARDGRVYRVNPLDTGQFAESGPAVVRPSVRAAPSRVGASYRVRAAT